VPASPLPFTFVLTVQQQSALPKAQITFRVSPGNSSNEAVVSLVSDNPAPFVFLETALSVRRSRASPPFAFPHSQACPFAGAL
jgi:hypothetical protein